MFAGPPFDSRALTASLGADKARSEIFIAVASHVLPGQLWTSVDVANCVYRLESYKQDAVNRASDRHRHRGDEASRKHYIRKACTAFVPSAQFAR
jgi:hypothetical protein